MAFKFDSKDIKTIKCKFGLVFYHSICNELDSSIIRWDIDI